MYDINNTFLQAELDYRADRARSVFAKGSRRHRRLPRARRPDEAVDHAR